MTQLEVVAAAPVLAEDQDHFVCCHDASRTFCGLVVPPVNEGWADEEEIGCAACRAVAHLDSVVGDVFCPLGGPCTHALDLCDCPPDEDVVVV